jgi:membrane protease YdiL (CAAX protease family)
LNIKTSPLVRAVTLSKRPTGLPVAWLVTIVFGVGVMSTATQTALAVLLGDPAEASPSGQLLEFAGFGATLAVLALWVVFKEQRPFASVGFLGRGMGRFFVGILGGAALFAIPVLTLVLSGAYAFESAGRTASAATLTALAPIVPGWIVQATTEEAVVRGYLLQWHGLKQPAWVAILLTSAGFAALHLDAEPLVLSNIFLVAIFFSFLSLAQGSIWLAAGVHAGWNMTQGSVFGIPVSGMPVPVSLLLLSPAPGSREWLTGGSFGVEGSVATTVILAIAVLLSYRYYLRVEAKRLQGG